MSFLTPGPPQPQHPLFIFLPGMDGTGVLLGTQVEDLKRHFDIRCAVFSSQVKYSWELLTEQVIEAIRQEQKRIPNRKIYLCGESFGGCLALLVTLNAPDLVNRLILVNPATAFRRRISTSCAAEVLRLLPEISYPLACNVFLPFLANLHQVDMLESQALLSAMQSLSYGVASQRVGLLINFDLDDEEYRRIKQPTLIVASDRDRLLPSVKEAYWLASLIPNAQVHRLPNSGHACLLERDVSLLSIMDTHQFRLPEVTSVR